MESQDMVTTILDLPFEVLDEVYRLLDWDTAGALVPARSCREDIFNISLTCRRLRTSVLPTLFRNVTLDMRWDGQDWLQPDLLEIRRYRPDLARYIVCVHIKARTVGQHGHGGREPFVPGRNIKAKSWLQTLEEVSRWDVQDTELERTHHRDVREVAHALHTELSQQLSEDEEKLGAQTPVTNDRVSLSQTPLEAAWLAFFCLPPTVKHIVFDARTVELSDWHVGWQAYGLFSTTMKIFKSRLEHISMITAEGLSGPYRSKAEIYRVHADTLRHLTNVKTITLASGDAPAARYQEAAYNLANLSKENVSSWLSLGGTVTYLDVRNYKVWHDRHWALEEDALMTLIKGFTNLTKLSLANIGIGGAIRRGAPQPPDYRPETEWLRFLVALRRARPNLDITLRDLFNQRGIGYLSASAVAWLEIEAIPAGACIDEAREERLVDDFYHFLFLWKAEDSGAGRQAAQDRTRHELVDTAMRNRAVHYR